MQISFRSLPSRSRTPSQPFPPVSSFFYFPLLVFFIYDRLAPLLKNHLTGVLSRVVGRGIIAIASLGRTRFFAVRRDFHEGESSASRRRPRGLVVRMRRLEPGERADSAERRTGGGEAPAELINSDSLLSARPFERQHTVMSVFDEGRLPRRISTRVASARCATFN